MLKKYIFFLVLIIYLSVSCSKREFNKKVLIGIWSVDSVYTKYEFNRGLFMSNLLLFEDNKIDFPQSAYESYLKTTLYCKKKNWDFLYSDTLGYFITYWGNCNTLDTAFIRFINDSNIRQLRCELKFKHAIYYARKGLAFYEAEREVYRKLETLSKVLSFDDIHSDPFEGMEDTFNRFTQQSADERNELQNISNKNEKLLPAKEIIP